MRSIFIIGNSHLGALVRAENENLKFSERGYDVVYWGAAGGNFPLITYVDGILKSPYPSQSRLISGDRFSDLPVGEADMLFFYGCSVNLSYEAGRMGALLLESGVISAAFKREILEELIAEWWKAKAVRSWIEQIRGVWPDKPVIFSPQPYVAKHGGAFKKIGDRAALEIQSTITARCRAWADVQGVTFVTQPDETVIDGVYTNPEYTKDALMMRTDKLHDASDFNHMNAAYGGVVMRNILSIVDSL